MWYIHEEFQDSLSPSRRSFCSLNPEKPIIFGQENYPIKWIGSIAGKRIELIQKEAIMYSIDDMDFIEFPEEYLGMGMQIIYWINEKLDSELN